MTSFQKAISLAEAKSGKLVILTVDTPPRTLYGKFVSTDPNANTVTLRSAITIDVMIDPETNGPERVWTFLEQQKEYVEEKELETYSLAGIGRTVYVETSDFKLP